MISRISHPAPSDNDKDGFSYREQEVGAMLSLPRLTMLALCAAALGSVPLAYADGPPDASPPGCCAAGSSCCQKCPPPAYYSCWRYWAPALAKCYDNHCGPKLNVYAPDRHPEVPLSFNVLPYRCQPNDPETTILVPPTPPPGSVVH
jgi:hypothetical protein